MSIIVMGGLSSGDEAVVGFLQHTQYMKDNVPGQARGQVRLGREAKGAAAPQEIFGWVSI
ncbi:MAG: hypothetical protein AAFN09_00245 [Pseudomonadota bacterium]